MRILRILAAASALATPTVASAEIAQQYDDGFVLKREATVQASPEAVYRALGQVDRWWDGAHT